MDNIFYSQGKLREYADAFRRLTDIYGGSRAGALLLQLKETAAMLERISGGTQTEGLIDDRHKNEQLAYNKKEKKNEGDIHILDPTPGRIELLMRLSK